MLRPWICLLFLTLTLPAAGQTGPDIIVAAINGPNQWGTVGDITGYSFGATCCNPGDMVVSFESGSNQHPVLGQQLYRLEDGRFEQIGMSWLSHGFCALNQSTCGPCVSTGCESLGIGCADTSSSSVLGQQASLGPRSDVDPATGLFSYPFPTIGQSGDAIFKRLQVAVSDLDPALHPQAQYFAELVYVAPDEVAFGTQLNNYGYRPVTVGPLVGGGFNLIATGATVAEMPALGAWQAADPQVVLETVDIPGDGRLILGTRVSDLGGGQFHYEYALFNQNSDRSVGSFSVPVPFGVTITNLEFSDVDYHSGEPYSGAAWAVDTSSGAVTWSTEEFSQNEDANALRWSTTYNFRFDADAPPENVSLGLGIFQPGTPDTIDVSTQGPSASLPPFVRGDADGDSTFNGLVDGLFILNFQFTFGPAPECMEAADVDGNDVFSGLVDALFALTFQFAGGPPPPSPGLNCGADDNYLLGCAAVTCP